MQNTRHILNCSYLLKKNKTKQIKTKHEMKPGRKKKREAKLYRTEKNQILNRS